MRTLKRIVCAAIVGAAVLSLSGCLSSIHHRTPPTIEPHAGAQSRTEAATDTAAAAGAAAGARPECDGSHGCVS